MDLGGTVVERGPLLAAEEREHHGDGKCSRGESTTAEHQIDTDKIELPVKLSNICDVLAEVRCDGSFVEAIQTAEALRREREIQC